jgi:hypothetical protein
LHLTDVTDPNSKFCFSSSVCKNEFQLNDTQVIEDNALHLSEPHNGKSLLVSVGDNVNKTPYDLNGDCCVGSVFHKNILGCKESSVKNISVQQSSSFILQEDQSTGSSNSISYINTYDVCDSNVLNGETIPVDLSVEKFKNVATFFEGQSTGPSSNNNLHDSGHLVHSHDVEFKFSINDIDNCFIDDYLVSHLDTSIDKNESIFMNAYGYCADLDSIVNKPHPNTLDEGLVVCSFDSNNNVGTRGYVPCIYVGSDYSVSSVSNDNYLVQLDDVNSFNFNLNRFGNGNVSFDYIDLDHVISCQVIDCQICSFIRGSFITFIHNSLGFIPHSSFHSISSVGRGDGVFQIVSNIGSYLNIQQYFKGIPNFISKIAPVASHINVKLFGELLQGFYDT